MFVKNKSNYEEHSWLLQSSKESPEGHSLGHLRQILRNIFDEVRWKLSVLAARIRSIKPLGIDFKKHIHDLIFLRIAKRRMNYHFQWNCSAHSRPQNLIANGLSSMRVSGDFIEAQNAKPYLKRRHYLNR